MRCVKFQDVEVGQKFIICHMKLTKNVQPKGMQLDGSGMIIESEEYPNIVGQTRYFPCDYNVFVN